MSLIILKNNIESLLLFLCFFVPLSIITLILIFVHYNRYLKYSNGIYKNRHHHLIFKCSLSKEEIIDKLYTNEIDDTLYYEFWEKEGEYFFNVKGVKRFFVNGNMSVVFKIEFVEKNGIYIVIHLGYGFLYFYSVGTDAELYEFMVKKLGCIPKEKVEE